MNHSHPESLGDPVVFKRKIESILREKYKHQQEREQRDAHEARLIVQRFLHEKGVTVIQLCITDEQFFISHEDRFGVFARKLPYARVFQEYGLHLSITTDGHVGSLKFDPNYVHVLMDKCE